MKTTLAVFLAVIPLAVVRSQTAEEIVRKSEDLLKGETSRGTFRMTIVTPDYTRSMEMESWWVGNSRALIVIKAPRREAGNKTLKVNNELWMYLRNTETTIKIPPSMMLQSWNGSDFTNDDLVRESNLVDDYSIGILGEETVGKELCWKIELLPKPTAPVVWGKILYWVRKKDFLAAKIEYYDEKNVLMRTMEYSEYRVLGGRKIPSKWTMVNNVKKDHRTEFQILDAQFNVTLSERIFSFQELEKGRTP